MQSGCIKCKGRGNCGRNFCPITAKSQAQYKVQRLLNSENFSCSSPAPFVGKAGYPDINVGILSPPERKDDAWEYDAPRYWADNSYQIPRIIELRSSLINSRFKTNVKNTDKFLEISQEIGMATKPVELEIQLDGRPYYSTNYDSSLAPIGPNAKLRKAELTSNPSIPRDVDKVVDDHGMKAQEAMLYLNKKGHDENFLSKLLSVGTIGIANQRKLVPTRWSITAVDDLLAKDSLKKIRGYPEEEHTYYSGNYLGNYYFVMFFPDKWGYELFEAYLPKASWNISGEIQYSTDYEGFNGRKDYAENCAGGYYAARLAATEKLLQRKRQAGVLCIRIITGEYAAPLGVWVCREAARKAMNSKPISFDDRKTMLEYCKAVTKRKFGYDISQIMNDSVLLQEAKKQTRLTKYI
jgi:hypothetical protein